MSDGRRQRELPSTAHFSRNTLRSPHHDLHRLHQVIGGEHQCDLLWLQATSLGRLEVRVSSANGPAQSHRDRSAHSCASVRHSRAETETRSIWPFDSPVDRATLASSPVHSADGRACESSPDRQALWRDSLPWQRNHAKRSKSVGIHRNSWKPLASRQQNLTTYHTIAYGKHERSIRDREVAGSNPVAPIFSPTAKK
jgi:hypothetical protein